MTYLQITAWSLATIGGTVTLLWFLAVDERERKEHEKAVEKWRKNNG